MHNNESSKPMTVTLIGATGLIGGHLLQLLKLEDTFEKIKVLVRRPVTINHPKVEVITVDFSRPDLWKQAIAGSDAVFCAVGTTQQKVKGNKDAYRKVDYDIPVAAAQACLEQGCPQFLLVSSVGADAASRNFYLKLKGEVEDAVMQKGIPSLSIFRPSMLLGARKEFRLGEKIAQVLMPAFAFLMPSKYKPITAKGVAASMVATAKQPLSGTHVYHYREMMGL
jgi:uncharacterized protein YbjT (DUF2867 family)